MLKRALLVLASVALLAAGYALAVGPTVVLKGDGPEPRLVTVAWGEAVTFTNADNKAHSITIPRIAFESPAIPSGGTFEKVFDGRRGNYLFRQTGGGASFPATIIVNLTATVTLSASAAIVDYGKSLRLSGKSTLPNWPVTFAQRVPGQGNLWTPVSTVTAAADGSFSLEVEPKFGARYRAQVAADQVFSDPVLIRVRPGVEIKTSARRAKIGRRVTVSARIMPAIAATSVDLERFDPRRKRWLTDARQRLSASGRATFRWAARKGTSRIRVAVKPLMLQGGWSVAASPAVTITGV